MSLLTSPPVMLLKTRSSPADNYAELFSRGFAPSFIPVLSHEFELGPIQTWIQGAQQKYGGLIFTSQRAVEAFASALALASGLGSEERMNSTASLSSLAALTIDLYVVGPATGKALKAVADRYLPKCQIKGRDTGNGAELAQEILKNYARTGEAASSPRPPLLFFVGEVRRDIIPKTLMSEQLPASERVQVDEQVVYQTKVEESFEAEFKASIEAHKTADVIWVVVFSPTGCDSMLRVLSWKKDQGLSEGNEIASRKVKVATIGPTTRDHLKNEFGFESDVCAEKPSPEGVRSAIEHYMEQHT